MTNPRIRPSKLDTFFAPITTISGVGSKLEILIRKVISTEKKRDTVRIFDLLFTLPYAVIDRRERPPIASTVHGAQATLEIHIDWHQPPSHKKKNIPYKVYAHDNSSDITLVFFHMQQDYLKKILPENAQVLISGKIQWLNGQASMAHPDYIVQAHESYKLPSVEPVYALTKGLSAKILRQTITKALERIPELPEWHTIKTINDMGFQSFKQSLQKIHNPKDPLDVSPSSPAWRRLSYDELFAGQIALEFIRMQKKQKTGKPLIGDGRIVHSLEKSLPYCLTESQKKAFQEIKADLSAPERMLRLLQGDVGSGKTVVALFAMAQAAENGGQSALMAPTDILARQHQKTLQDLTEKTSLTTALITGQEKRKEDKKTLSQIEEGAFDIVVGTHALFQDRVKFKNLALVVIDEQHRFGVHQRLSLTQKGYAPDILVMTATPIPRTLMLTAFGDINISVLSEKPEGRKPIRTVTLPLSRINELIEHIHNALKNNAKIYWICPLVEESEAIEQTSVLERSTFLRKIFRDQVGLIHGRMKGTEKDQIIEDFRKGVFRLLVATSVIEVGMDVPDASIMIIEHAESFGLAQLHQLRGRVGRGTTESSCVLLYRYPLGDIAQRRLSIMRKTDNGFLIAEEDLKLRGHGELLGTKQSGAPEFRMVKLDVHEDLIRKARDDAKSILAADPELTSPRGQAIQLLLYLFGHDGAIDLLKAG